MATDYDAPRTRGDSEPATDFVVRFDTRRSDAAAATLTVNDDDDTMGGLDSAVDSRYLLTGDELTVTVVAQRPDEFTCSRCFLVQHRSRYSRTLRSKPICRDCS